MSSHFVHLLYTPGKQATSDILGKMSFFDITVRSTLSALMWYQNQVHTPPTFWDMTICV